MHTRLTAKGAVKRSSKERKVGTKWNYVVVVWWTEMSCTRENIQSVPLATEPGISLIILLLIRILLLRVATIRRTTDTFLFISHTTNVVLFKFRCNIFIDGFGSEWDTLYFILLICSSYLRCFFRCGSRSSSVWPALWYSFRTALISQLTQNALLLDTWTQ